VALCGRKAAIPPAALSNLVLSLSKHACNLHAPFDKLRAGANVWLLGAGMTRYGPANPLTTSRLTRLAKAAGSDGTSPSRICA
jgi:hypothetical protein